jgi:hypothetical protein
MFKKGKYLLVLVILLVVFTSIIITNAQEVSIANSFRFPLEGDWSPLWQDFGKWNNQWNGYHLGEDVGREDADIKNYAVYPMANGIVKFADIVMGYTVIIEHKLSNNDPDGNYVCSVYYHMKRPQEGGIKLTVGESVSMDIPIGYVSGRREDYKSSPHLHFGIRRGHYKIGKDPRTGFWYYPGYTTIKKDGEVQKDPNDPTHKQILADWFYPSTDPKNGTGFIERHIAKIEQATEISKTTPIITAPLKITPSSPYHVGDTINAEFNIANKDTTSITFSVLTVGGRDPDNQVADFTHRQNITLEPSAPYNYQGTLTLNKVGDYHFFCTYQTPDGNWNTNVDLGSGLADEDRIEDIVVKEKDKSSIVPEISDKINIEWDRSFEITDYQAQLKILENGDIQVNEIFEYDFDGDFNGIIRTIGIKGSDGLQYFKASEYFPMDKELNYDQSIKGDMVTFKIYDKSGTERKLFLLEYQLKNVITLYNDTAEFYWKFFDESNTSPIGHVKIEVELPGEITKEELKVFGHGPLDAEISIQEDGKIVYEVYRLSSGEMVETRILFPTNLVPYSIKKFNENKFAEIMEEESGSIEALEEEITAMEAVEDKIEKEKLLIDSSLYHIECNKPIVSGNIFVVIPVSVSGPADELALILTNPKGETDIRFISKRALIDNFETVKLRMGNAPLSEGPYILTVKTVTPEKVIYKTELWFTSPDVSIADAEFTYKITHLGGAYGYAGYYFLEMTSLTLINNGDLPAKRDSDARALITLDGKPENMTLLTRRYSISPYEKSFYPPTYIPNGKNKIPARHLHAVDAMYGLKKGQYFVTITIPLMGGETVSFRKALTIE